MPDPITIILILVAIFVLVALATGIRIVPQKRAFIIERLGRYTSTWEAGLHVKIPLIDRVAYTHTLKEQAIDVPPQTCITRDNISVEVDGILYMQVVDPRKASYGIDDYRFASIQLAQTTMRSVIGRLDLDKTFEERETINGAIVEAVDKASDPWGVKVTRTKSRTLCLHKASRMQWRSRCAPSVKSERKLQSPKGLDKRRSTSPRETVPRP